MSACACVRVYDILVPMFTNIPLTGILLVGDGMVKQSVEHGRNIVCVQLLLQSSTSFSSPALVWVTLLRWMKQRTKEIPAPVVS